MKFIRCLAVFGLLSVTTLAQAGPVLTPGWQVTEGLAHPESVVLDTASQTLFVSNVNGDATAVDGNGYIAKLSADGKMINSHWVTGLNAPKGLALFANTLYVADINQLVAIDITTGKISQRYPVAKAKFLNDVAVDKAGHVYVSGMLTNTIYRLADNKFSLWLQDDRLISPNGLFVQGDTLVVGGWGHIVKKDFTTDTPGHLLSVNIASKKISAFNANTATGNFDGVEADGKGNYLVTDWVAGKLLLINPAGSSETLLNLTQGSADLTFIAAKNRIIIPLMLDNKLVSYSLH